MQTSVSQGRPCQSRLRLLESFEFRIDPSVSGQNLPIKASSSVQTQNLRIDLSVSVQNLPIKASSYGQTQDLRIDLSVFWNRSQ